MPGIRLEITFPAHPAELNLVDQRRHYPAAPLDTTRIQIAGPFGRDLLSYLVAERDRVGQPAG